MKSAYPTCFSVALVFSLMACSGSNARGADDAAVGALSRWKDNAAAKMDMDKIIAGLTEGDMAASWSRIVAPAEGSETADWVRSRFDDWSGDLRAGCYTTRTLCVKANGNWGIAFFAHLKGNLDAREGAAKRFATPNEHVNHWGMACHHSADGWKLVPPGTGRDLPGYNGFLKDFMRDVSPLSDAVKKQYADSLPRKE